MKGKRIERSFYASLFFLALFLFIAVHSTVLSEMIYSNYKALSTIASILVCNFLNAELANDLGTSIFVFGITSFAVLVAVALLTVIIATFLPVYNAARKKPVESIRAL